MEKDTVEEKDNDNNGDKEENNKIPDYNIILGDKKEKNKNKKLIGHKKKTFKKKKKISNPGINHFNINSKFIYDLSKPNSFITIFNNKNNIKLNQNEINFLKKEINDIKLIEGIKDNDNIIRISCEEIQSINDFFFIKNDKNDTIDWVKTKISQNESREKISCKKLSELYYEENGNHVSKTKIYNILKNKLKLHFLKTSIKTSKLKLPNSIFMSLCFIKIITRAIIFGFDILFLDESAILSKNNNYRCWRGEKEQVYFKMKPASRSNLLLIINKNQVIHYKINKVSTTEDTFLEFLIESIKKIKEKKIKEYLIVLDNLSSHKTAKIINYFNDNNINVVFNCPYNSQFNCVELTFRYIKRYLYSKIYESLDKAECDVIKLLDDKDINKTLIKNYKETLEYYLSYSLSNEYKNLNNLDYSK